MAPTLSGPVFSPASGNAPKQLVVLLHGLGADGQDLIELAPALAEFLPNAQFVAPNAPFPCDMSPFGYQWFGFQDLRPERLLEGARIAAPVLDAFLTAELEKYGLDNSALALAGFSQGTMMALHVGLRRRTPCAGILGFSGALLGTEALPAEITARPPVCLVHGMMDMVVPFAAMGMAAQVLGELNVPVETHTRPMLPHGIDPEGIRIGGEFLKRCLR